MRKQVFKPQEHAKIMTFSMLPIFSRERGGDSDQKNPDLYYSQFAEVCCPVLETGLASILEKNLKN